MNILRLNKGILDISGDLHFVYPFLFLPWSHLIVSVRSWSRIHHVLLLSCIGRRCVVHHLLTQVAIVVVWLALHLQEHLLLSEILLLRCWVLATLLRHLLLLLLLLMQLILLDLLHQKNLLLFGELLLVLSSSIWILLGCLVVLSNHVGLWRGRLRLRRICLCLMLTWHCCLLSHSLSRASAAPLTLDKDIRVGLSWASRRGS